MIRFDSERADAPVSLALLADYFASREQSFPVGLTYRISYPDPADFVPPKGEFLILREVPDVVGSPTENTSPQPPPPQMVTPGYVPGEPLPRIVGRPLGCGGIRRLDDLGGASRFELKNLWLSPDARSRGWGRRLLEELESRARDFGAHWLVLDTNTVLETAGHLYRTSGFVEVEPYNANPNANRWFAKELR